MTGVLRSVGVVLLHHWVILPKQLNYCIFGFLKESCCKILFILFEEVVTDLEVAVSGEVVDFILANMVEFLSGFNQAFSRLVEVELADTQSLQQH